MVNDYQELSRSRLSLLLLSIKPKIPIVKREHIPTPAKKAYLYIFSFASGSLSCKYFIRYCVICAIFNAVDPVSFMRFIVSLVIVQITFLTSLHSAHGITTNCWSFMPVSRVCSYRADAVGAKCHSLRVTSVNLIESFFAAHCYV